MATGAGKTRTVIALCDLLMRCNWAKRILFLADRVALVNQALNAFKTTPARLISRKSGHRERQGRARLRLDVSDDDGVDRSGQRRAKKIRRRSFRLSRHRRSASLRLSKVPRHLRIFRFLLVGLTATPKDEVDRNTYSLFDLEEGVPTDAYPLEDAVKDEFLVPMRSVAVPLKFQREGIKYDDLSEDEKDEWDAKEWNEDGVVPDRVEAEAVNKWLFNEDTVDKVLEHLMTRGTKGRWWRSTREDDHLCEEPRSRAFLSQNGSTTTIPNTKETSRGSSTSDRIRPEPDRQLLDSDEVAAHRDLRRYARHGYDVPEVDTSSSSSSFDRRPSSGR